MLNINDHTVLYPGRFRNSHCEHLESYAAKLVREFRISFCSVHMYIDGIVTCNVDFLGTISYAVAWSGWILLIVTEMRTVAQWRDVF
jgi:hypothetical protein